MYHFMPNISQVLIFYRHVQGILEMGNDDKKMLKWRKNNSVHLVRNKINFPEFQPQSSPSLLTVINKRSIFKIYIFKRNSVK